MKKVDINTKELEELVVEINKTSRPKGFYQNVINRLQMEREINLNILLDGIDWDMTDEPVKIITSSSELIVGEDINSIEPNPSSS